ncbi:MAG: PfkB family carbohydrate kinase [Planctomycetota bacterium]|nr:PfkB family carbohydrate kinase [Planctomycetota bacterium]
MVCRDAPERCRLKREIDVLGLGAVAVDDILFVESYPAADAKMRVLRRERHCGGLAATALVAAARLGGRCAYAGALGEDELSKFVLDCLDHRGVDVSYAKRVRGRRPVSSCIVVGQDGRTRNIFFDLNGVVGAAARWPAATVVRSCRVLLVDNIGVPGMIRAARIARRHGIPVVADFESDQHPQFGELLELVDHLIVSRDFAAKRSGVSDPAIAVQKLWATDREAVVVTAGASGCWYRGEGAAAARRQPAFQVAAVDTTGCGDVFHGAYAFGLARGLPLDERIRLASATAALKATRPGGQAGIPSLAAVKRFLQQAINAE